jgi:hypothetical protein
MERSDFLNSTIVNRHSAFVSACFSQFGAGEIDGYDF